MGALLSKAAILAAADLKHEDVEVPSWGGTVRIAAMSGLARDEFRAKLAAYENGVPVGRYSALLLAACCVDENGDRLFTVEDVEALEAKSAASLDAPAMVAMRLNGVGGTSVADAVKNSESGQSGDSGSDLPKS